MKTYLDCIPCFVRQTLDAARTLELENETTSMLLRRILGLLQQLDWSLPPPVIGRDIHRAIRETTNDTDPYLRRKITDTESALKLLPEVEATIADSNDPFPTAVKFSIAGNAIDLGAKTGVDADINKTFERALTEPVDKTAVNRLEKAILNAKSVLFLADNAGEIVFDRPLLEQIGSSKVTVAVRGSPVINDATLDDAKRSGITERFRVLSNGSDTPGTWLSGCSREFVHEFESADLVIAKGQGNYESLSDQTRKIFFLFLAKCPLVSEELDVPINTYVIQATKRK
jgi:uncharacterized protein with ATP-grasp and redox domains